MTISPIDTSLYTSMIDSIGTFPSKSSLYQTVEPAYTEDDFSSPVDLSNYYQNLADSDLLEDVANNVSASMEQLDNAMVAALENGMSVQDAVNVSCCLNAYKANCQVAKSTFELRI